MMRCGLGGGAGGRGSYSISLRGAAKQSLEKDAQGDSLPSNLLSCLLGAEGRGILEDQLWGCKCMDRIVSEPK